MENVKLGRTVLNHIDQHPELFDMGSWAVRTPCGTVACLAGTSMLLSGYKLIADETFVRPDGSKVMNESQEAQALLGMDNREAHGVTPSGQPDYREISIWFDMQHGLDRFRRIVEESEAAQR